MSMIKRLKAAAVFAGVGLSLLAGCRRSPSTASRSAAAYDEAQRQGTPVGGGGPHGDHGPSPAADDSGGRAAVGSTDPAHGEHATTARTETGGHADMNHAAMGHAASPGSARPTSGTTAPVDHAAMGHGAPAAVDHSAMGHSQSPMPPPSPEPASATAAPGQPAATLRGDGLDGPAATSVQEAARAAAMAAAGHTMSHGTYRQMDAGRPSPSPKENR